MQRRDGSAFSALVTDAGVHAEDGSLVGIVGVSTNLGSALRPLLERSSDAALVLTTDAVVRYASPAVRPLFGWHPDELLGKSLTAFIDARNQDELYRALHEPVSRPATSIELRVRAAGETVAVEASFTDLRTTASSAASCATSGTASDSPGCASAPASARPRTRTSCRPCSAPGSSWPSRSGRPRAPRSTSAWSRPASRSATPSRHSAGCSARTRNRVRSRTPRPHRSDGRGVPGGAVDPHTGAVTDQTMSDSRLLSAGVQAETVEHDGVSAALGTASRALLEGDLEVGVWEAGPGTDTDVETDEVFWCSPEPGRCPSRTGVRSRCDPASSCGCGPATGRPGAHRAAPQAVRRLTRRAHAPTRAAPPAGTARRTGPVAG